jgi:hypothetical protein
MIPIASNHRVYFLSIVHVTRQPPDKLIYGVLINSESYYIAKTIGTEDCVQLDSKPALDFALLVEICDIITRFEITYVDYPSLEFINIEIIKTLDQIRSQVLPETWK